MTPVNSAFTEMTPQDEHLLRQWAQGRTRATGRVQLTDDGSSAARQLDHFLRELSQAAPFIPIRSASDQSWRSPALMVGRHGNIAYQAVPRALELSVFLEALSLSASATPLFDTETAGLLAAINLPVELTLFIAPACPHCPRVAGQLIKIAMASAMVRLTVVDVELMPESAQAAQIRSVPTLLLEKRMRWTGLPDLREVLSMCVNRDPTTLSAHSLRQLLETGDAGRVARMMIAHRRIFPALIDLLCDPKWPVRLGAMVTVEFLSEEDQVLAGELADPLWHRFGGLDEQVQGDVAHILGQIDTPTSRGYLVQIANGPYAEAVRHAAMEILDQSA